MATDQEIRDAGFKYIPQQKYLQNPFELPTAPEAPVVNQGIVNTNAFAGGGNNNIGGNLFGYGTAVSPVFGNSYIDTVKREGLDSFAAYDKLSQAGGTAPAGMYQTDYFPGTQNELADAMGRMPGQEGYDPSMDYSEDAFQKADDKRGFLSRLMNNAKQKMTGIPNWAQAAITTAGMLNPFTAIPKLLGMTGGGDTGPTYGIAGLTDAEKAMYDNLASQGMLFSTSGGFKTLTGKNFAGKGYVEGQIKNYNEMINEGYTMDSSGNVIKPDGTLASGYLESKFKESSNVFGQNEKTAEEEYQDRVENFVKNYKKTEVKDMFDKTYDGTNIHGDPSSTTTNNDNGGGTYIGGGASIEDAGGTYDGGYHGAEGGFENTGGGSGFSPGSQSNSPGHPSNRANGGLMYANGGRAGYFYGGRVSVMKGGLASIL